MTTLFNATLKSNVSEIMFNIYIIDDIRTKFIAVVHVKKSNHQNLIQLESFHSFDDKECFFYMAKWIKKYANLIHKIDLDIDFMKKGKGEKNVAV